MWLISRLVQVLYCLQFKESSLSLPSFGPTGQHISLNKFKCGWFQGACPAITKPILVPIWLLLACWGRRQQNPTPNTKHRYHQTCLQVRKPKFREIKRLPQDHTVDRLEGQNSHGGLSDIKAWFLPSHIPFQDGLKVKRKNKKSSYYSVRPNRRKINLSSFLFHTLEEKHIYMTGRTSFKH